MLRVFFLLLNLVFVLTALGQHNVKKYTTIDGLPHDITYGIIQDSKGFIWIGTDDGLSKFNGNSFTNYTINNGLNSNYVIDVAELKNENLAVATWRGGLHILDREKDSFIVVKNSPKHLSNITVIGDTLYNHHLSINQTFWKNKEGNFEFRINSYQQQNSSLSQFNKSSNTSYSIKNIEVNGSNIAIANTQSRIKVNGVFKYQKNGYNRIFPFLNDKVVTSLIAINDNAFLATADKILYKFSDKKILEQTQLDSLYGSYIVKILPFQNKYCLLTEDTKGFKYLYEYDQNSNKIKDLNKSLKINATISDILVDKEENLWISSFGDGIFCVLNNNYQLKKISLNKNILKTTFFDDATFFLSNKYLHLYKNSNNTIDFGLKGFGKDLVTKENKLLITTLGFFKTKNIIAANIDEISGYKYFKNKQFGDIVVNDSIRFLKSSKNVYFDKTRYNIFDAVTFNDTLFFATNIGLFHYNAKKNNIEKNNFFQQNIGNTSITSLLVDDSKLYLGTDQGLWINTPNNTFKNFSEKEGLIQNRINYVTKTSNGAIWIGTQKGLSIFDGFNFLNRNQESGLQSSYINHIAEDAKNRVWIAGNSGVSVVNTNFIEQTKPPFLVIEKKGNLLSYSAISYNRSQLLTAYQINDSGWTTLPSSNGEINITNYKPGNYKIIFRSKKIDSNWAFSKEITFKIPSKWYQKWWVIFLLTISIPAIILSLISIQLKRSKKQNKRLETTIQKKDELEKELISVRDNISKDFHDDLGNKLARITMFSSILSEENKSLTKDDKELVELINEDANYIYKGTKDFIFSLQTKSDNLEEVITYLSDFGEDYLKLFDIVFTVEKDLKSNTTLPYYWSKQIIFIFKEALTNAVKHSNCNEIKYVFIYDEKQLTINCEDDGKGFLIENLKHSNGLKNCVQRAEKIGCKLEITSKPEQGTAITFKGKLPKIN